MRKLFPHIVNHICIQNEAKLKKNNIGLTFWVFTIIAIVIVIVIFHFKFLFILSSIFGFNQAVPCFFNFILLMKVFILFLFREVRVTLNIATNY